MTIFTRKKTREAATLRLALEDASDTFDHIYRETLDILSSPEPESIERALTDARMIKILTTAQNERAVIERVLSDSKPRRDH